MLSESVLPNLLTYHHLPLKSEKINISKLLLISKKKCKAKTKKNDEHSERKTPQNFLTKSHKKVFCGVCDNDGKRENMTRE